MTAKRFIKEASEALTRLNTTSSAITVAIAKARNAVSFIERHRDNKLLKDFRIPSGLVGKLEERRRKLLQEEEQAAKVSSRGYRQRIGRY